MRRAEVWKDSVGGWECEVYADLWNPGRKRLEPSLRISARDPAFLATTTYHSTHEAALSEALASVGLTPTNPEEQS